MDQRAEQFRQLLRSYGEITPYEGFGEPADNLYIKAWGVHVRALRAPGATEPNYHALYVAAEYRGYGFADGVQEGKRQAFAQLRELIGAKAEE